MKSIISVLLFLGLNTTGWAQSGFSASLGAVLDVTVTLESKTEPPQPDVLRARSGAAFLGRGRPQGISRFIADTKTHEYTGYDMRLEPVNPGQYRVTFGPLTLSPNEMGLAEPAAWHSALAPVFPPPQVVTTADTIIVDVMENPGTGQKIVDYVQLKRRNCDAVGEGPAQVACLTLLVEDARRELQEKLERTEEKRSGASLRAIIASQESWTRYKNDACSNLETDEKRLNCEIELIRSRIHDFHVY
jgi:hypothetical protein